MEQGADFQLAKNILNDSNIGLWAIEIDEGKPPKMYADRAMLSLLGRSPESRPDPEQLYRDWYNNIDPASYRAVREAVIKMTCNKHAEVSYTWYHPTNGVTHMRCSGLRNYDYREGVRLEGIHQDVSELILTQNAYEVTHDILSNANIGLWAIELEENYPSRMYADATMLTALGIKEKLTSEQLYHTWYDRIDPEYREEVDTFISQIAHETHAEVQYAWHHPDGQLIYIRLGGVRNKLNNSLTRLEGCHQDITSVICVQKEMEKMQIKLKRAVIARDKAIDMAIMDPLTRVYNRKGLYEKATDIIRRNRKKSLDTLVMYIDMDNLKKVNDTFGHDDGDFCITAISSILKKYSLDRGVIGRLGGDEFSCIVTQSDTDCSEEDSINEIKAAFDMFNDSSDKPYIISVSIGCYTVNPSEQLSIEEALAKADERLYEAKSHKSAFLLKADKE